MSSQYVLAEVAAERARQDAKWGQQDHPDDTHGNAEKYWQRQARAAEAATDLAARQGALTWAHILLEEVYEALAETDPAKRRAELVQVAAVAVAQIEAIDRRSGAVNTGE